MSAGEILTPDGEAAAAEIVRAAAAEGRPLEIRGGGSRAGLGRPVQAAATVSTAGLSGVSRYEPGALTLVVGAGTPMAEITRTLDEAGQMFAFEPMDHRALFGTDAAEPTIGGAAAVAAAGPRRIQAGGLRDSLLGARFVNGSGEAISSGGRVMKNVTGYDLAKLMAGAHGTLGLLSELSFRTLPKPETASTLLIWGLSDAQAVAALSDALGSPFEVSGAAHLPAAQSMDGSAAVTMIRLEGFAPSVADRAARLREDLAHYGEIDIVDDAAKTAEGWAYVRDCRPFAGVDGAVWRVSVKPSDGPTLVAALGDAVDAYYDWGGGLVWLRSSAEDAGAAAIRAAAASVQGRATLVRASAPMRAAETPFPPNDPVIDRLSAGLRARFDPKGVLNPGRMAA